MIEAQGYQGLSRKKAYAASLILAEVIRENPSCFEGEDLTLAYALEDRLRTWGAPVPSGTVQTQELLNLNPEDSRIIMAAQTCKEKGALIPVDDFEATVAPPMTPGALTPKEEGLPVLPLVVAGLGLVGIIAAIAID